MNQIMEHDPNLTTRGQRYWSSIGNKDYDFNQRKLVVTEIEKLTREDLIKLMMKKCVTSTATAWCYSQQVNITKIFPFNLRKHDH